MQVLANDIVIDSIILPMITKSFHKKGPANGHSATPVILIALALLLTAGCSVDDSNEQPVEPVDNTVICSPGVTNRTDCPPEEAIDDERIRLLHEKHTWIDSRDQSDDPVQLASRARKPVQRARTKIVGAGQGDASRALAAKLWMIENAQHTIDVAYYIFKRDRVGHAILGALCNAVKRGVDVRLIVDSVGSIHPVHSELKALAGCASEAGFMRNDDGRVTTTRARMQVIIFNALTRASSWPGINRRLHDKLLIADGHFPDKAIVMTGGRNISLAYYGFDTDGSPDPDVYHDMEILLRSSTTENHEPVTVGNSSSLYYYMIFLNRGNKHISPGFNQYYENRLREKAQQSLAFIKNLPEMQSLMADMSSYMTTGFHESNVRLAHELDNLGNENVLTAVKQNKLHNPNSIMHLIYKIADIDSTEDSGDTVRVVSPYLFVSKYYDMNGELVFDGARALHDWLDEHPNGRLEIITNSVLTSDNFFAQSIIDMELGPRLLLSPEIREAWRLLPGKAEINSALVASEAWKQQVNHPRIFIYETGKLDSAKLGGNTEYGKLHSKYVTGGDFGFVGTSNFDYRSRLYNNEMGFFVEDHGLNQDLVDDFKLLKSYSYRWGSPEWLQMRHEVREAGGFKGRTVRYQRQIYKLMKATGLDWLF